MRRLKTSRSERQSWGFLFSVIVTVAFLSLLVLVLIGTGLTGFVILTPQPPTNVTLSLDSSSFPERTLLEGDVVVQIDGPLDQQTQYYATLEGNYTSMRLTQALEAQNISYHVSASTPQIASVAPSLTLLYDSASTQQFVFRLPRSVRIQSMQMNIHGRDHGGSYPSFPKIDANHDGQYEWEYVGDFLEFNESFVLPAGLHENQENTVGVTEQQAYYCELINLPRGKDFLVSAKYRPLLPSSSADLEVVLFSVSGSGANLTGLGGTNVCDLDEDTSSAPEYHNCRLSLPYVVSGNSLVCVHNAGLNLSPDTYYELSRDIDQNSGYRCGALTNGRTTCVSQQGDFFIKVQQAHYDGVLNRQALISEGAPEALLPAKLNEQLQTCTAYDNYCYLPLDLTSEGRGTLYLDALDILYSDQGTPVHERNFYTLSSALGVIDRVASTDLTLANYTLTLHLELLQLAAPSLRSQDQQRNFTLEVGITPGPSVSQLITVVRSNATDNATFTGNFTDDVAFYQQVFNSLLQDHAAVLEIGGYTSKIETVLQSLSQYATQSRSASNASTSLLQLEDQIMDQIKTLPQYIAPVGSASFTPSVSTSDFEDDFVYPQQRSEQSKQQLAYLQQQYAPTISVETLEVVLFNKQEHLFTVLEHSTSASFGNGKMITIFPSALATSTSSISFTQDPRTTLSTSPLAVSWDLGSLPSTMQYVVKGNLLSAADDLRLLFIPETIPKEAEKPRTTCGDGVCSVIVSEGQKIYLEDGDSCPVDCGGTGGSWTWIIALLLLGIIGYYYFGGLYKGPWHFQEVLQRLKKGGTKPSSKLFSSASDEANLRSYVQNALRKGVTREAVTTTLLNRGWTKQQIDSIMKQAKL